MRRLEEEARVKREAEEKADKERREAEELQERRRRQEEWVRICLTWNYSIDKRVA